MPDSEDKVWTFNKIDQYHLGSTCRISMTIGGYPLWFESEGVPLKASVEAFIGIFIIPSLHHQAKLKIELPVDKQWLENSFRLCALYSKWWNYTDQYPIELVENSERIGVQEESPKSSELGLCFTGGVDSFYSLLEYPDPTNYLVFAHGYDIQLDDWPRLEAYKNSLQAIAEKTNKKAIIIRTNLRQHPLFNTVSWEQTHGSALAALGLILSPTIGGLVIPPSYASTRLRPWGSHPETDPLYSTSNVKILHHSTALSRLERIQLISNFELAQQHLRVCYINITLSGNCSICEKCVMTMTSLDSTGNFQPFQTFSHSRPIPSRIDDLNSVSKNTVVLWEDILEKNNNKEIQKAISNLVSRSTQVQSKKHNIDSIRRWLSFKAKKIGFRLQRIYILWFRSFKKII